jgi:hypothetical protein
MSNVELLHQTQELAAKEREITTQVLWHLKEVSDRRLYSARGYSSLFAYAVNELKYSDAAAGRRVAAMRLLVSVPEMARALESGALNLSSASAAQSFFRREETEQGKKYSDEDKEKVLESLKDKSKLEVEKILVGLSPPSATGPEKVKPITATLTELKIYVNEETLKKLEKLKNLLAHQNPTGLYGNLLGIIADLALDKVDPERIEARIQKRKVKVKGSFAPPAEEVPAQTAVLAQTVAAAQTVGLKPSNPRSLSRSIRRQVYLRDRGCCSFQDPVSGRVCGSSFQTQIEHVVPVALGGTSELTGLKIYCRSHNLWSGVEKLGKEAMAPYIRVG